MASIDDEFDTMERRVGKDPRGGLLLMVSAEGLFETHALPDRGRVTIGRASDNLVRIGHPSVSRRHAVLHLGSGSFEIEDLGSSNGVRVQEQALEPLGRRAVAVGEVIELGEVMLVVRRATATVRPRRLWPHGYFEGRVEEQCARAERGNEMFAVLRLSIEVPPPPGTIEASFASTLRALDVLALYAPGEYEVLLVDTLPEDAEGVAARLTQQIGQRGGKARAGLAIYPRDGRTPEAIIARACDAVSGLDDEETEHAQPTPTKSPAMRALRRLIEQVAGSDLSVLILGETGVGKEVTAEAVHELSRRRKGPFLRLHCASFSESLLESELFGHEKGAFTGAHAAKPGLLETAQGGTVLLDEIGELPLATQVKLLRVLEERKVMRIGALQPRSIDVRFIAATNRDLEVEVSRGRFRLDLYYRLNGVSLLIPPLRERTEEIEPLARSFIEQACRRMKRNERPPLSAEALKALREYSWPGNIRELRNTIERAILLCGRGPILSEHLSTEKMGQTLSAQLQSRPHALVPPTPSSAPLPLGGAPVEPFDGPATTRMPKLTPPQLAESAPVALHAELNALEKQRILDALEQCAGNQSRAARLLGISRGKLIARLDAYGIPRPRK